MYILCAINAKYSGSSLIQWKVCGVSTVKESGWMNFANKRLTELTGLWKLMTRQNTGGMICENTRAGTIHTYCIRNYYLYLLWICDFYDSRIFDFSFTYFEMGVESSDKGRLKQFRDHTVRIQQDMEQNGFQMYNLIFWNETEKKAQLRVCSSRQSHK